MDNRRRSKRRTECTHHPEVNETDSCFPGDTAATTCESLTVETEGQHQRHFTDCDRHPGKYASPVEKALSCSLDSAVGYCDPQNTAITLPNYGIRDSNFGTGTAIEQPLY